MLLVAASPTECHSDRAQRGRNLAPCAKHPYERNWGRVAREARERYHPASLPAPLGVGAARYLRLCHPLPRYYTPVCHYIHACFGGEVKAEVSGFWG